MFSKTRLIRLALLWGLALLLVGCSNGIPGIEPTLTNTPLPTETPTPTETATPTSTPLPPVGVLLVPVGADQQLADQMQSFLSERVPQEGLRFQVRPSLALEDFERDDFLWVVALPPYEDLGGLAASTPQTRYLAVGFDDLAPAANLTVIALPEDWYVQQAFMAGYIGMVITPDWRAGMIRVNTPEGEIAAQAFYNGALFFCSSPSTPDQDLFCRPVYAPVYQYPIITYGEPETLPEEWTAVGRYMVGQYVETVFVSPEVNSDQLLRFLAQEEVEIIGAAPPPNDLSAQWVASVEFDLLKAFEEYWPEFAAGTDGTQITVPLEITNVNPDLLSPGRQQFIEKMLADVLAGYIQLVDDTNVNNP